jgi:hypothetical protein
MDWIQLVENRIQWRALVSTENKLLAAEKLEIFQQPACWPIYTFQKDLTPQAYSLYC